MLGFDKYIQGEKKPHIFEIGRHLLKIKVFTLKTNVKDEKTIAKCTSQRDTTSFSRPSRLLVSIRALMGGFPQKKISQFSTAVWSAIGNIYLWIFLLYSETLNKECIERIHQMSFSSLSDYGMLQIFSFLIKWLYGTL